jgi:hypothetical protein
LLAGVYWEGTGPKYGINTGSAGIL